ncbi:sensor histidine kinase [Anaerocolumna sp. MB42-C2]|uniref:sensor histidine kinase n=1 Tax=Anaerocolumna sp. MB42-C2 TaxID=3070997 RepID=UPI0027DFF8C1|nr:sensor histidine kinase [Anaerocolumna sp. MB42-C2]WMJ86011.1 sensor histidine kinase [Anaerocolumna sp. MB42-C2]
MDYSSEIMVKRLIWIFMVWASIIIILLHIYKPWHLIFISGLLLLSFTLQGINYPQCQPFLYYKLILYIEVILVFFLQMNDLSGYSRIYYYVLIADATITYSCLIGAGITGISIFANFISYYINSDNLYTRSFWDMVTVNSSVLLLFFSIMCLVKYEINQRRKISKMMYDLKVKSKLLEDTNIKLCDNANNIEDLTILKERNRIAREIHDTLGHTLTSVLIELEAGERLMKIDKESAAEKIGLAKGQVRKGLNDIRESVGILNKGKAVADFTASLKLLLDETARHGEIFVRYEISDMPPLTEFQEKALFRALQEGLTNGIKHGKSSAFIFLLNYDTNNLRFHLQDNGTGCDKIVFGFGLSAMEYRIREVGGILDITSSLQEGCCINITIPIKKRECMDED